jgi:hypothetical protein
MNAFLPAAELQSEVWNPNEKRRSAFGLPKRTGFPAGYNGQMIRNLENANKEMEGWLADKGYTMSNKIINWTAGSGRELSIPENKKTYTTTSNNFNPSIASFDDGNKYSGASL